MCDFHIHTGQSDGALAIEDVVKLFGTQGFDVIAITDHVLDSGSLELCRQNNLNPGCISKEAFIKYLKQLQQAVQTAWDTYGMVLIPGVEITNDTRKFHLLCIDIKEFIDPDLPVEEIIKAIHQQGGIAFACHPQQRNHIEEQQSRFLWDNHERFSITESQWEDCYHKAKTKHKELKNFIKGLKKEAKKKTKEKKNKELSLDP